MSSPTKADADTLFSTPKPGTQPTTFDRHTRSEKRKRMSSQELLQSPDLTDTEHSIVLLVEEKLKHLEKLNKLDILDTFLSDVTELKNIVSTYQKETNELKNTVATLQTEITHVKNENKLLKESLLDLKAVWRLRGALVYV